MFNKKYYFFLTIFIYMISLNIANGQEKIKLYKKDSVIPYGIEKNSIISREAKTFDYNSKITTTLLSSPISYSTKYKISVPENSISENEIKNVYNKLNLSTTLDYSAFKRGYLGFKKIDKSNPLLTIIDFTKPSTEKRLFVIDLDNNKVLYNTHVSHGKNSGENYAKYFSNELNSYKSSPGFYKTETTYRGSNGYSLRLDGLEKGINDNAYDRAIVVHGASYANPNLISDRGRLGRSLGCPALPTSLARPIIDTIKNGSVLYIHVTNPEYTHKSSFASL